MARNKHTNYGSRLLYSKFKVGDRVKVVADDMRLVAVGYTGVVTKIDNGHQYLYEIDSEKYLWEYELELVPAVEAVAKPDASLDTPLTGGSSSYYELPEDARELGDLIEHKRMNFNVGNIFKAAYRLGEKPGTDELYDLNKIIWFTNREINRIKKSVHKREA
jgi:hypothetical protein